MRNLIPIILCGGSGSRLWPLSRESFPKQFIRFNNENSLFQQALIRLYELNNKIKTISKVLILTSEKHRFIVLEQIEDIKFKINFEIILEPDVRNTSPALTFATQLLSKKNLDDIILVTPCDQLIKDVDKYVELISYAVKSYDNNSIYLMGVKPTKPNTGFGYIKWKGKNRLKEVLSFHEKPSLTKAKKMLSDGNYLWNSGMFLLTSSIWISSIRKLNSKTYKKIINSEKNKTTDNFFIRPEPKSFNSCESTSIDYEVVEKFRQINLNLKILKMNFLWDDLGSFLALEQHILKKQNGNKGYGDFVTDKNSKNNIVINECHNKLVVVGGVKNLLIVSSKDIIFIYDKTDLDSLKNFVKIITTSNLYKSSDVDNGHRPWGYFSTVLDEENFKVKKIVLKPHSKISLQSHKYRNEHWVVVKGKASIIKGSNEYYLKENESIYINKNEKHRLSNDTSKNLEIIEVQTGSILDESDIIRYSDLYNRK